MKKVNQLKKDNLLLSAWTLDGKIFVTEPPQKVNRLEFIVKAIYIIFDFNL